MSDLGRRVCDALGIDPRMVGRITITLDPQTIPLVTVERFVIDAEDNSRLIDLLSEYRLVPILIPVDEFRLTRDNS